MMFELFDDDHARWAKLHGVKVVKKWGTKWAYFPIPCTKLKDNKCSIYKRRPELCKLYECGKK
jgi:Fe-S-cluster containining protein